MTHPSIHTFNIPVMGLAYTIDSPIRVAHLGISSVISIMDDELIEKMNAFYSRKFNLFANTTYFKTDTLNIQQQLNQYQAELNDIKIPETVMA